MNESRSDRRIAYGEGTRRPPAVARAMARAVPSTLGGMGACVDAGLDPGAVQAVCSAQCGAVVHLAASTKRPARRSVGGEGRVERPDGHSRPVAHGLARYAFRRAHLPCLA